MKDEEIILMDSPEAASIQTVTGWVSREGVFWGQNEHQARYGGCTHRKCEECSAVIAKNWIKCPKCQAVKSRERFLAMPVVEWDGVTPLVLNGDDRYFFDRDSVIEYAEEQGESIESLPLVLCVPNNPWPFDANDMFCDYLPEDFDIQDVSPAVAKAVDALNEAVKSVPAFSWVQGKERVILK